jgi:lysozyme
VAEVHAEARVFLNAVEAHYGQRPILYTTVDFYEENRLWEMGGVDFWLRSTAAHPSDRYPGQHWLIWQYSGTGLVPGIKGKVDLNAFAGDRRAFAAWLAAQN